MLKIGVCDDDSSQIEQINNWLSEELFQRMEFSLVCFSSGEEVVEAIEKELFDVHLLFMDIHMKKLDGMETAAFIRQQRMDVDIIFLTVSRQHVYNGYIHKAYAYLLKPMDENIFKKVLNQYVDEWEQSSGFLEVITSGGLRKIWLNRVLYFSSDIRVIDAHFINETIRFYGKLDDLEQQLESDEFIRCHKSFLVNRIKIDAMTREWVEVHGEQLPISRSCYGKLKQKGLFHKDGKMVCFTNHKSLSQKWGKIGAIVGIAGKYTGAIIRIQPNQKIVFGRNAEVADFVLDEQAVSRSHCWVQYDPFLHCYYVCDDSVNGTLVNESYYLERNRVARLKSGDELCLADTDNVFKLG